jgi:tetratricopeptide (TPR) repeat protein
MRSNPIKLVQLFEMLIAIPLLLLAIPLACAQNQFPPGANETQLRDQAYELCRAHNYLAALPLLEQLNALHPDDTDVLERLAISVGARSNTLEDPAEQMKLRLHVRELLERAKKLGDKSNLLTVLLEQYPTNGERTPYSPNPAADKAMLDGEIAWASGNIPLAMQNYQRSLDLDPKLYTAALFLGDSYFNLNQAGNAGTWFAKAIAIDPNRETAYRYWGDTFLREGKMREARDKYIDAIVARPYLRTSWVGLIKWAKANQYELSQPRIEPKSSISEDGKVTKITVDSHSLESADGSTAWMMYGISRAARKTDSFKKEHPQAVVDRHSLEEEVDALKAVIESLQIQQKEKKVKELNPQLALLLRLHTEGLLEPYVLISSADAGIAQDYDSYREQHRDKLHQYIAEFIVHAPLPDSKSP